MEISSLRFMLGIGAMGMTAMCVLFAVYSKIGENMQKKSREKQEKM